MTSTNRPEGITLNISFKCSTITSYWKCENMLKYKISCVISRITRPCTNKFTNKEALTDWNLSQKPHSKNIELPYSRCFHFQRISCELGANSKTLLQPLVDCCPAASCFCLLEKVTIINLAQSKHRCIKVSGIMLWGAQELRTED